MDWLEELPEQLRSAPFIGKAESLDDAVGKLAHAAKLVGTSVRIPGEDASQEDKDAFYGKLKDIPGVAMLPDLEDVEGQAGLFRKLGAPEDASDYALPELDDFEWDEGVAKDLRAYAHEAGLTKAQFKQFASKIGEQERQAGLDSAEQMTQNQKALKEEWGADYDNRDSLVRGWLEQSEAPDSMKELMESGNLPPEAMNWLYNTAKNFDGDVKPMSREDRSAGNTGMTPAEAKEKMVELRNHPAYFDREHPLHREYVERMVKFQRLALG